MCYSHRNYQNHGKGACGYGNKRAKWAKMQAYRKGWGLVPVNVQELDDKYELHLFAAGYQKEDFKLSLVDNILTISVKKDATETPENARWRRQEFSGKGFTRQFELNDSINAEAISAAYENGVLKVTLPKIEGKETKRQKITID